MSAERADDKRTVDQLRADRRRTLVLQTLFIGIDCCCRDREGVKTVSFPLAPGASGWLPALADIPKFKCAPRWSNEAIENVRNTSGDELPLF
jgi:hypothetical protein